MHLIKKESKRGQYFLIAAIIIVIVLFGVVSVSNKLITSPFDRKYYDLSKELNLESESVVNYGIIGNPSEIDVLMEGFTKDYGPYAGENNEIYFVFGNLTNISVYMYDPNTNVGTIYISTGGPSFTPFEITRAQVKKYLGAIGSDKAVRIKVSEINYDFKLKEGQNFFFIIKRPKE